MGSWVASWPEWNLSLPRKIIKEMKGSSGIEWNKRRDHGKAHKFNLLQFSAPLSMNKIWSQYSKLSGKNAKNRRSWMAHLEQGIMRCISDTGHMAFMNELKVIWKLSVEQANVQESSIHLSFWAILCHWNRDILNNDPREFWRNSINAGIRSWKCSSRGVIFKYTTFGNHEKKRRLKEDVSLGYRISFKN